MPQIGQAKGEVAEVEGPGWPNVPLASKRFILNPKAVHSGEFFYNFLFFSSWFCCSLIIAWTVRHQKLIIEVQKNDAHKIYTVNPPDFLQDVDDFLFSIIEPTHFCDTEFWFYDIFLRLMDPPTPPVAVRLILCRDPLTGTSV